VDYQEALKKVRAEKPKEHFMMFRIETGYSERLILPQSAGVALLAALANAEILHEEYDKPPRITGVERDGIRSHSLSHQEYEQIKIAQLLHITLAEVQQMAAPKPPQEQTP
jgi:hypothetical protein